MGQLTDLHAPPDNVTDKRLQTWRGGPKKEKEKRKKSLDDTQLHLHNSPISSSPALQFVLKSTSVFSRQDVD